MHSNQPERKELFEFLSRFISDNKKEKFSEYIRHRTRHLTIVLEDIYQPHNASAVLRSCDCFGIQDVHIIENNNRYQVNPDVALGSSKWLTLKKYNKEEHNTIGCLTALKESGYRIVATSPHKNDFTPDNLPLDQKVALVFGTELEGLSKEALSMADYYLRIPMFGFTESLNISVSAALLLYSLTRRLRSSDIDWQIPEDEQLEILIAWTKNVLKKADKVEEQFLARFRK